MALSKANLYKIFYLLGVRKDYLVRDFREEHYAAKEVKFFEDMQSAKIVRAACRVYFTVLRHRGSYENANSILIASGGRFDDYFVDCTLDIPALFKRVKDIPTFLNVLAFYIKVHVVQAATELSIYNFEQLQWYFFHFDVMNEEKISEVQRTLATTYAPYGIYFAHSARFRSLVSEMLASDSILYSAISDLERAPRPTDIVSEFRCPRASSKHEGAEFYGSFPAEKFESADSILVDGTAFNLGILFKAMECSAEDVPITVFMSEQSLPLLAMDWHPRVHVAWCPEGEVHTCLVETLTSQSTLGKSVVVLSNSESLYRYHQLMSDFTLVVGLPVADRFYRDLERIPDSTIVLLSRVCKQCVAEIPAQFQEILEDCCDTYGMDKGFSSALRAALV